MICDNFGGIRDPFKQDLALEFCRKKSILTEKNILTETHINHGQIHYIRNNLPGPIFFSPGDSHTKGLFVLFHLGLEGIIHSTHLSINPPSQKNHPPFLASPSFSGISPYILVFRDPPPKNRIIW